MEISPRQDQKNGSAEAATNSGSQTMQTGEETELSHVRCLIYDANGNLTNDGNGKVYAYDATNRMVSITQASGVTGFAYDGLGRRVQETLNGTLIKQWVWCGGAQPCEERDASNNVTKRFFNQGEQIGISSYFFTHDHLGSVREMTDANGNLIARYDYDPYGRRTLVSGTDLADFSFTGDYYHAASGLDLTVTRAYDANLGRWLSRDTIGENGGINLYRYVGNSPINAIDPFGLQTPFQTSGINETVDDEIRDDAPRGARAVGSALKLMPDEEGWGIIPTAIYDHMHPLPPLTQAQLDWDHKYGPWAHPFDPPGTTYLVPAYPDNPSSPSNPSSPIGPSRPCSKTPVTPRYTPPLTLTPHLYLPPHGTSMVLVY
jgi:RHS repeat-associated protein